MSQRHSYGTCNWGAALIPIWVLVGSDRVISRMALDFSRLVITQRYVCERLIRGAGSVTVWALDVRVQ